MDLFFYLLNLRPDLRQNPGAIPHKSESVNFAIKVPHLAEKGYLDLFSHTLCLILIHPRSP